MMISFNEECLVKNRCVNLVDKCVTLNNEKSTMDDKISKMMNYNLLVLNKFANPFFFEKGFLTEARWNCYCYY